MDFDFPGSNLGGVLKGENSTNYSRAQALFLPRPSGIPFQGAQKEAPPVPGFLDNFDTDLFSTLNSLDFSENTSILHENTSSSLSIPRAFESNSLEDILEGIKGRISGEWELSGAVFYVLTTLYILVILTGAFGNLMVLFAILYRKTMRTAHNSFIGTLAMSDFLLCLVTLPVNLWEMLFEKWPFGEDAHILCSLMMAAQKFPIFLSSMAIVAIGYDRYRCVITPEK